MTTDRNVLREIQQLLAELKFGVLATHAPDYPHCSLVGYGVNDLATEMYFATLRDTRKFANLKANPGVSILVDSSRNQADDLKDAMALTAMGTAEELASDAYAQSRACFLSKHPYMEDFLDTPNCALVRIAVSRYILVSRFQNVVEYTI